MIYHEGLLFRGAPHLRQKWNKKKERWKFFLINKLYLIGQPSLFVFLPSPPPRVRTRLEKLRSTMCNMSKNAKVGRVRFIFWCLNLLVLFALCFRRQVLHFLERSSKSRGHKRSHFFSPPLKKKETSFLVENKAKNTQNCVLMKFDILWFLSIKFLNWFALNWLSRFHFVCIHFLSLLRDLFNGERTAILRHTARVYNFFIMTLNNLIISISCFY